VCGTWRRTPPEVAGSQEIGRALDTQTSQTHVRSDPSRLLGHFLAVFDHTCPRLRSFPGPGAQPVSGAGAPSLAQFCPGPGPRLDRRKGPAPRVPSPGVSARFRSRVTAWAGLAGATGVACRGRKQQPLAIDTGPKPQVPYNQDS